MGIVMVPRSGSRLRKLGILWLVMNHKQTKKLKKLMGDST